MATAQPNSEEYKQMYIQGDHLIALLDKTSGTFQYFWPHVLYTAMEVFVPRDYSYSSSFRYRLFKVS